MTLGSEMYAIRDLFVACPPVYTLPGTWSDPEKIARCNDTLIPHFTFNPKLYFWYINRSYYYSISSIWNL